MNPHTFRAPRDDATSTAVGVARPNAHGHATTSTSTARRMLSSSPAVASDRSSPEGAGQEEAAPEDEATAADMAAHEVMGSVCGG